MLPIKTFTAILAFAAIVSTGCEKETKTPSSPLRLSPEEVTGKSGKSITTTLSINSSSGAKNVVIYKTVNLTKDNTYGDGGTLTVVPEALGGNSYKYDFSYQLKDEEIDKLVGFNFRFTDNNGTGFEKDLTVHTTTSGQTILYSRKWKLTSRMWTSVTPNVEDMKDCEGDNIFSWNKDSTYSVNFGPNTGAGSCQFDGFNVFEKWELSEDEKTFKQRYHSLFDPSNITNETFTVKELTSEKFVVEQLIDLTIFGLSDKEKFVSTYVPAP
ncbi:MAG: hypothetical protein QM791_18030 [Ferruginibacter sp.]